MGQQLISLVDADADLADLLDEGELERARHEALTRVQRLSPGEWDAAAALELAEHHRGFLIIDGLLSRTVDVLGRRCVELVGHGDVMRPWQWDDEGSHVRAEVGWMVLEPSRLAVLDHRARVTHRPVAAARAGAVQPGHAAGPPSRGRARDRAPPARRRPPGADALAPRRALGPRPPRRHRRPAAARPPAPGRPRGRPAPVRHDRHGRPDARRDDQPPRQRRLGAPWRPAGRAAPPQARGGADADGHHGLRRLPGDRRGAPRPRRAAHARRRRAADVGRVRRARAPGRRRAARARPAPRGHARAHAHQPAGVPRRRRRGHAPRRGAVLDLQHLGARAGRVRPARLRRPDRRGRGGVPRPRADRARDRRRRGRRTRRRRDGLRRRLGGASAPRTR